MRSVIVGAQNLASIDWNENYFKFCQFEKLSVEGAAVCSDFIDCTFSDLDWYWGLFTSCNFVNCSFNRCVFRGTAFPDTRFVECRLTECQFMKDNLDADCDFSKTIAYGCVLDNSQGFSQKCRRALAERRERFRRSLNSRLPE